jgi:hypothetical protein
LPFGGQHASASAKGSSRSASSFFGEFTRVDMGQIAIGSDGNGVSSFDASRSRAADYFTLILARKLQTMWADVMQEPIPQDLQALLDHRRPVTPGSRARRAAV